MQTLGGVAVRHTDDLCEAFTEMRGHLYLHAGTLVLKLAQDRQHTWRTVTDLAALCFLLAYQVMTDGQEYSFCLCSKIVQRIFCFFPLLPGHFPSSDFSVCLFIRSPDQSLK